MWVLAHEIFCRHTKYIMLIQLILMVGKAIHKAVHETGFCKVHLLQFLHGMYGRNAATDPCDVFRFGRMDGARVTETAAHTGQMITEECLLMVGSCVVSFDSFI